MSAPTHELVGMATSRLRSHAPLTALVGSKIYYRPVANMVTPYVVLDDASSIRADATCINSLIVNLNVHVWTDDSNPLPGGGGALQDARAIAYEVANALHHYPIVLPTASLVTIDHQGDRVFYDADGSSGHAVCSFEAIMEY